MLPSSLTLALRVAYLWLLPLEDGRADLLLWKGQLCSLLIRIVHLFFTYIPRPHAASCPCHPAFLLLHRAPSSSDMPNQPLLRSPVHLARNAMTECWIGWIMQSVRYAGTHYQMVQLKANATGWRLVAIFSAPPMNISIKKAYAQHATSKWNSSLSRKDHYQQDMKCGSRMASRSCLRPWRK